MIPLNFQLAQAALKTLQKKGVKEYCVCPGARNAPFIELLRIGGVRVYYFFDERSAAFFALGRIRQSGRPVGVVTTSGTAVGELLPATMEAYYSALPLVLLTADRPRSYRGTGAPQSAEQVGIFGKYVAMSLDLENLEDLQELQVLEESGALSLPHHLNVCFDEPLISSAFTEASFTKTQEVVKPVFVQRKFDPESQSSVQKFLQNSRFPIVLVSLLRPEEREPVAQMLLKWQLPTYFEATSGLREDPRMQAFCLRDSDGLIERALKADYFVDSIIRIGGVPTLRLWRDLEKKYRHFQVLSLSSTPFSGLSRSSFLISGNWIERCKALSELQFLPSLKEPLLALDRERRSQVLNLLKEEPSSEPGMVYALSEWMGRKSVLENIKNRIYLGNSLPIREWDLAASHEYSAEDVWASRGLNGIDGQISTFLGYARAGVLNWALVGDLTALYDLQAPWILSQLENVPIQWVIMNNGGGKIFSKMFASKEFQNNHTLQFAKVAEFWNLTYSKWHEVPKSESLFDRNRMIELIPDDSATVRFWERYAQL